MKGVQLLASELFFCPVSHRVSISLIKLLLGHIKVSYIALAISTNKPVKFILPLLLSCSQVSPELNSTTRRVNDRDARIHLRCKHFWSGQQSGNSLLSSHSDNCLRTVAYKYGITVFSLGSNELVVLKLGLKTLVLHLGVNCLHGRIAPILLINLFHALERLTLPKLILKAADLIVIGTLIELVYELLLLLFCTLVAH